MQQVEESPAASHSTLDGERELVPSTSGAVATLETGTRSFAGSKHACIQVKEVILFDSCLLCGSHSSNLIPRSLATVP